MNIVMLSEKKTSGCREHLNTKKVVKISQVFDKRFGVRRF